MPSCAAAASSVQSDRLSHSTTLRRSVVTVMIVKTAGKLARHECTPVHLPIPHTAGCRRMQVGCHHASMWPSQAPACLIYTNDTLVASIQFNAGPRAKPEHPPQMQHCEAAQLGCALCLSHQHSHRTNQDALHDLLIQDKPLVAMQCIAAARRSSILP